MVFLEGRKVPQSPYNKYFVTKEKANSMTSDFILRSQNYKYIIP